LEGGSEFLIADGSLVLMEHRGLETWSTETYKRVAAEPSASTGGSGFCPDHCRFVVKHARECEVTVCNSATLRPLVRFKIPDDQFDPRNQHRLLCLDAKGEHLMIRTEKCARIVRVDDGRELARLPATTEIPLRFSDDGRFFQTDEIIWKLVDKKGAPSDAGPE